MVRLVQLCMGPAGSGKSTFCGALAKHLRSLHRGGCVLVNLDPAAESLPYSPNVDIRELVSISDTHAINLGPNGGLVYCLDYLAAHLSWFKEILELAGPSTEEHIIFDCPGQIELFTHVPSFRRIIKALSSWGYSVCGTFLIDAAMVVGDVGKYTSAILLVTCAMIQLAIPWISLLSKVDLIPENEAEQFCDVDYTWLEARLGEAEQLPSLRTNRGARFSRLNRALLRLVEDVSMVRFLPLDVNDYEMLDDILNQVHLITQYSEDLEPRDYHDEEPDVEDVVG